MSSLLSETARRGESSPGVDPSLVLLVARSEVEKLTCRDIPSMRSVETYSPDDAGHADYRDVYHAAYEQVRSCVGAICTLKSFIVQSWDLPLTESSQGKLVMRIVSSETFLRGSNEQQVRL